MQPGSTPQPGLSPSTGARAPHRGTREAPASPMHPGQTRRSPRNTGDPPSLPRPLPSTAGEPPALSAPCWTRGRRFACQARMQPRSAALRDTKWPLSGRRVGASATGNPGFMPSHCHACIDLQAPFVIHYRFPRANLGPLHQGAEGVAVVTCPSSPGPEPGWPSPPRRPPRGSLS